MEESHKTHRPHIKVGKDEEKKNQVFIQMYFTPEDFFYVFIRLLSQVFIRDAPGISEKDENRSKSTKVTKVTRTAKLARAHILSFTETSEPEAFHDPVSVTQTRRSESVGYNHCCLPESGDG